MAALGRVELCVERTRKTFSARGAKLRESYDGRRDGTRG